MDKYATFLLIVSVLGGAWGIISTTGKTIKPLIESITKLDVSIKAMTEDLKELRAGNTAAHARIWTHEEEQDQQLKSHETRISILEHDSNKGG